MKYRFFRHILTPKLHRGNRGIQTTFISFVTAFFVLLVSSPCVALAQDGEQVPAFLKQDSELTISLSQEEEAWLGAHPEIRVGLPEGLEPYVMIDQQGNQSGILVDYKDELNRVLGINLVLKTMPSSRIFDMSRNREIDAIYAVEPVKAEQEGLLQTNVWATGYPAVYARQGMSFNAPDDLVGKTVVMRPNTAWDEKLILPYSEEIKVVHAESPLDAMKMVLNGKADIYLGLTSHNYNVTKYRLFGISQAYVYSDTKIPFVIGVRSDWPLLASILNKGLTHIGNEGLGKIVAKWVYRPPPQEEQISLTDEEQAWLDGHPDINLGFADSFEPYLIVNDDGSLSGVYFDILQILNKRLGTNIGLRIDSVTRILEKAQKKEVDGILSLHPDYTAKLGLVASDGYNHSYPTVFASKETSFFRPADFSGKNVAIIDKVYFSEDIIEQYGEQANIIKVANAREGLQKVQSGSADFYIGLSSNNFTLHKYRLSGLEPKYTFFDYSAKFGYAVRSDWPELVSILNKGIASFSEQEIESIVSRWMDIPVRAKKVELTDEEQTWLTEDHRVRVRIVSFPPYIIPGNGQKPEGINIDYLELISERTGVKFDYSYSETSFSEALEGLIMNQGPDVITSIMRTPERAKSILFSDPYISAPYVIFTNTNETGIVTDITDIIDKRIAMVKGTVIYEKVRSAYPGLNVVLLDSDEQALWAVSTQKADAYIGNLTLASYLIVQNGLTNVKISSPAPFGDHVFSMGIRNDWPELASIINKGLATISSQEHAEIRNKYVSIRYEHFNVVSIIKWILVVGGVCSGIVVLFIFWNRSLAKQVEDRTAELLYQAMLLENVTDAVVSVDMDFKIISWNKACERIYGWKTEEVMGKVFAELTAIEYQDCTREEAFRQIKTEGSWCGEVLQYGKDKEKIYMDASISLVRNNTGEAMGYVGVNRDITEQKRIEAELKKNEEFFSKAFYSLAIPMAIINVKSGERIDFNDGYADLCGYSRKELKSSTIRSMRLWVDPLAHEKAIETLLREGVLREISAEIIHKSGEIKSLLGSAAMIELGEGNLAITAWIDITKRISVEEKLRVSEEKFFKVFQASPSAICVSDLESGRFVEVNQKFESLFGYTNVEVLEKNAMEIGIWKNPSERDLLMKDYLKNRQLHIESLELVKRSGETIFCDVNLVIMDISGIDHSIAIISDITKRKEAGEKILNYQARLKALASQLTIAEETERNRIAAELHDHVGQTLAFSHIQVGRAQRFTTEEKLQEILAEISEQLLESIQYTKELVFDLSPPLLHELGLTTAISDWLKQYVSQRNGIKTELIGSYRELSLSRDLKSILFRNVRELLANVIKHSQATKVVVSLESSESELIVTLHDNGVGFESDSESIGDASSDGFGLFSIRERLDDFGGSLDIRSSPGMGCTVVMKIPILKSDKGEIV